MSNTEVIRERRKIVKKYLREGLGATAISKKLLIVQNGAFKASLGTIKNDIVAIRKEREQWDATRGVHHRDDMYEKRQKSIEDLERMIEVAKSKGASKTAGELIEKLMRLQGLDKLKPKDENKDKYFEKYKHRTQEEINNILLTDFKNLAATLMRSANNGKLNNIIDIRLYLILNEKGKKKKIRINRYGEDAEISD